MKDLGFVNGKQQEDANGMVNGSSIMIKVATKSSQMECQDLVHAVMAV